MHEHEAHEGCLRRFLLCLTTLFFRCLPTLRIKVESAVDRTISRIAGLPTSETSKLKAAPNAN